MNGKPPLPSGWSAPEIFEETFRLGGLSLQLCGFSSERRETGVQVTGSSAGLQAEPDRAYYELLERCLIVDATHLSRQAFPLLDARGKLRGKEIGTEEIFPAHSPDGRWTSARSNGIAVHRNFSLAAQAAKLELIEREAVLRSWFGESSPLPIALDKFSLAGIAPLARLYRLEAAAFPATEDVSVTGIFGFPRSPELPLIFGFGAAANQLEALQHALGEAFQRLGFVYDPEFVPSAELPDLEKPGPDLHLSWFLHPKGSAKIKRWLERKGPAIRFIRPAEKIEFIELAKGENYSLVKAVQPDYLPLRFGIGYEGIASSIEDMIHPIA